MESKWTWHNMARYGPCWNMGHVLMVSSLTECFHSRKSSDDWTNAAAYQSLDDWELF